MTAPLEHNLGELASWIQLSIDRLTPAEQRKLLRKIGQDLRRVNRERMAAQTDRTAQHGNRAKSMAAPDAGARNR